MEKKNNNNNNHNDDDDDEEVDEHTRDAPTAGCWSVTDPASGRCYTKTDLGERKPQAGEEEMDGGWSFWEGPDSSQAWHLTPPNTSALLQSQENISRKEWLREMSLKGE